MRAEPEDAQALYSLLAENATEMISRHRRGDRCFRFASPASLRVLGYAPDELVGRSLDELVYPRDLARVLEAFAGACEAPDAAAVSYRVRHRDGHLVWLESTPRPVPADGREGGSGTEILAVSREITKFKELELAIEKVAHEWRTTFDAASDVIILLDEGLRVARANRAAVEFFGRPFSELLWRPVLDLLGELALDSGAVRLPPVGTLDQRHEQEVYLGRKDAWVLLSLDPIHDPAGELTGAVHVIHDITERKQAEIALRDSLEQLRNLSARLESAREQERTRIAREIHDELGHALTVLKMDVAWVAARFGSEPEALAERTRSMSSLIDRTIGTVRAIATELRPSLLDDLGLLAAIEWEAAEFERRTGIRTRVAGPDRPPALDDERATAVFRIVQEALTNVARHAHAGSVAVRLESGPEGVVLEVRDDGRGVTAAEVAASGSLGIIGMRERARAAGGRMTLEGKPGGGTRLRVTLPPGGEEGGP